MGDSHDGGQHEFLIKRNCAASKLLVASDVRGRSLSGRGLLGTIRDGRHGECKRTRSSGCHILARRPFLPDVSGGKSKTAINSSMEKIVTECELLHLSPSAT